MDNGAVWDRQPGARDVEPSGRSIESSSFTDRETAERCVAENLAGHAAAIERWAATARPTLGLVWEHGIVSGARPEVGGDDGGHRRRDLVAGRPAARPDDARGPPRAHRLPVPTRSVDGADPSAPEWEALAGLFTGYLHQDVDDDHGSIEGGIAAFAREWPRDDVRDAAGQAGRLRDRFPGEDATRAAAEALGLEYHPPSAGQSYRAWLGDLQQLLWRAMP